MKTNVHPNSIEAFCDISDERSERAELIYRLLACTGLEMTDREIMQTLGFREPNAVRPRITELIDSCWLREAGTVLCRTTGKHVRRVKALSESERSHIIARRRARFEASRPCVAVQPEFSFAQQTPKNMTPQNRLGRFEIQSRVIDAVITGHTAETAELCALFGKCIVLEASQHWDRRCVEYLAWCEDFDVIPEAMKAPRYDISFQRIEDHVAGQRIVTIDVKFTRKTNSPCSP